MFRKMRRYTQELSRDECINILETEPRGVLAVHGEDGYPYAIPMNFIYSDNKIYFHSAKEGHKLDAILKDNKVSFCVMDKGFRREGGWALNIKSVVIFGRIEIVENSEKATAMLRLLGLKYYPTPDEAEYEVKKSGHRANILELTIDHMSGKLVNES